ncbi:MAG: hypothetical protein ABI411_05715 [Tahibacter sp.]
MSTKILMAGAVFAAGIVLAGCSGSQDEVAAPPASPAPAVESVSSTPSYVPPPAPSTTVSPKLSTPQMDLVVTHATTVLVDAQDRCNKVTGPLRDACHKQAQAFYEAAIERARNPPPPLQR